MTGIENGGSREEPTQEIAILDTLERAILLKQDDVKKADEAVEIAQKVLDAISAGTAGNLYDKDEIVLQKAFEDFQEKVDEALKQHAIALERIEAYQNILEQDSVSSGSHRSFDPEFRGHFDAIARLNSSRKMFPPKLH
jgi:hypothetical protein